ncbi:MAG: hypothetical protein AMXMBFR7_41320 [Planctomycetota bacterium]
MRARIAWAWGAYGFAWALASVLAGSALWGLGVLIAAPEGAALRFWGLGCAVTIVLASALALARALRQTPPRSELALRLEASEPSFAGSLLAAVEALERPGAVAPGVAALSAERAAAVLRAPGLRAPRPSIPWWRAHAALTGSAALVLLLCANFGALLVAAFLMTLDPEAYLEAQAPRFLEVRPGPAEIAAGDVLVVEALLAGRPAREVRIEQAPAGPRASAAQTVIGMWPLPEGDGEAAGAQRWRGTLGALQEPARYRLVLPPPASARRETPPAVTPWYAITLRPAAAVARVDVLVEPPAYARQKPRLWRDPERVEALQGSALTVLVRATPAKDLASGVLEGPAGVHVPCAREPDPARGEALYRASMLAQRSGVLRVRLESARPGASGTQALIPLAVRADEAPRAEARIPEDAAPEPEGLPVQLELSDDLGLARARLVVRALSAPETAPLAPERLTLGIPLAAGTRALRETWMLPVEGLDALLAGGFEYRVEAEDEAAPLAQKAQSAWRRWEPAQRGAGAADRLLEPEARRMRRLTRLGAFGKIPDPTPEELAQAGDLGAGRETPRELRRPGLERLGETAAPEAGSGAAGSTPPPAGDAPYDTLGPKGLKPKPPEGSRGDGNAGGSGAGETKPQGPRESEQTQSGSKDTPEAKPDDSARGEAQGTGGEGPSGAAGSGREDPPGEGKPGAKGAGGSGEGQKSGPGVRGEEARGEGGGSEAGGTSGGSAASGSGGAGGAGSEPAPNAGQGTRRPRDGGPKSGRELGAGSGEMAPPDLETLARMKGIDLEAARAYAQEHRLAPVRTEFGGSPATSTDRTVGESNGDSGPAFHFDRPPETGSKEAPADPAAPWRNTVKPVDPEYRARVEGYFRRLRGASGVEK